MLHLIVYPCTNDLIPPFDIALLPFAFLLIIHQNRLSCCCDTLCSVMTVAFDFSAAVSLSVRYVNPWPWSGLFIRTENGRFGFALCNHGLAPSP